MRLSASLLARGCATVRLPLCPAIAEASYQSGGRGKIINMYVSQSAVERNVVIRPLSSFAADFTGGYPDIKWLSNNYPFILCAFDARQVVHDRDVYISCMQHSPSWIAIVQSSKPEDLMLRETLFRENCAAFSP